MIFCSFGDMLRVPGSNADLFLVKARGGDVRIVYSPMDAVEVARNNPAKQVVFFAVGFETTAPANAMAVFLAKQQGIRNFSILVSHVLVPPALQAILESRRTTVPRRFSPPVTSAPSWATRSITRLQQITASPSWSLDSNRWIFCKAC